MVSNTVTLALSAPSASSASSSTAESGCDAPPDLKPRIAELQQFALYTAHEVKNPLRAVISATESLLVSVANEARPLDRVEVVTRLAEIGDESRQLNAQINDLVAVIALAEQPVDLGPVPLDGLVASVLRTFSTEFENLDARVEVARDLPTVEGDHRQLKTVLTNLVSNAVRYRHPDRVLRLQIRGVTPPCSAPGDTCTIEVSDNGRGIDPRDHVRIFAPLGRVDRSLPGYGLGLTLSQRIVERLGGSLGVESSRGDGARFWMRLTLAGSY